MKKNLNYNHFSCQIEKMCTFSILATAFAQIANSKMQTYFIFQALYGIKVSNVPSKF